MSSGDTSQIPELMPNTQLENDSTENASYRPYRASAGTASWLLGYGGPLLVVVAVLALMAVVYYFRWGFNNRIWGMHTHPSAVPVWLAFNDLGQLWSTPIGEQAQSVALSGYDGQFYFYMAENPAVIRYCQLGSPTVPLMPIPSVSNAFSIP